MMVAKNKIPNISFYLNHLHSSARDVIIRSLCHEFIYSVCKQNEYFFMCDVYNIMNNMVNEGKFE